MNTYIHRVNYYETDKMGISHHSNYIRWMEEARVDFLARSGYGLQRLETEGITSPVVSVECQYKRSTTFGDEIGIQVAVESYTGVKLTLTYVMKNLATGEVVLTARSSHCFIDAEGMPLAMKKHAPGFDAMLRQLVANTERTGAPE